MGEYRLLAKGEHPNGQLLPWVGGMPFEKRQNIDKGDLRKTHMITAFGFIPLCCLRRRAQIQTAYITVPSYWAQSQSHSSQAGITMNKYE